MIKHEGHARVELHCCESVILRFSHGVPFQNESINLAVTLLEAILYQLIDDLIGDKLASDHASLDYWSKFRISLPF